MVLLEGLWNPRFLGIKRGKTEKDNVLSRKMDFECVEDVREKETRVQEEMKLKK